MNDQMKTKLLEKLMDFLSELPDKEDGGLMSEGSEMQEGEPKVEMLSIDAKPPEEGMLDKKSKEIC